MVEKLKWAYKLLRSRSYVILTDKEAMVSIPLMDIEKFESQFLLGAQTASLLEFQTRLGDTIREHEEASRLLAHRQGVKRQAKEKVHGKSKVRKTTKTK